MTVERGQDNLNMKKYDVITFGSASEDIFVFSEDFFKKNLCFPLNEKLEMDNILTRTGGGGTNAAATFALQGLKTAYCGSIGTDWAGQQMVKDLKKFNISQNLLSQLANKKTNCSVILSKKQEGRVLLIYRDASNFPPKIFKPEKLKTKWFYIAPLAGEMSKKTNAFLNFAKKNNIKVALNPSKQQIKWLKINLKHILPKIDVILMNEIEANLLFGDYGNPKKCFQKIKPYLRGIFATGSKSRLIIFDGSYIYTAKFKLARKKVEDMTGGGDAFGSGLISRIIQGKSLEQAIQFASANAAACVRKWGAKEGLLKKNEKYQKVKVKKIKI
jgi:ribokinase